MTTISDGCGKNPPSRLGSRARDLWNGVVNGADLDSAGLTILEECVRTVDIIDKLTGALSARNQEWLRLSEEVEFLADGAAEIHLVVNPLLREIRQQRLALRQLLGQLKLGTATPKGKDPKSEHKGLFDLLEQEFNS